MTRSEYKKQANGWNTHEIFTLTIKNIGIHALKCPCWGNFEERFDNQRKYSDAERIKFAAIYAGGRYSDEPEEAPERTNEDETDYQPPTGWIKNPNYKEPQQKELVMEDIISTPTFALYSISYKKFIAILSQEGNVMEFNPAIKRTGIGAQGFLIPIKIALEMHSGAKGERQRVEMQEMKIKFIEEGQQFYVQLCTKARSAAS